MITYPRFALVLSLALAIVLAPLSLASTGCTASQLRTASVIAGAAGQLACQGAVVALDLPGWSGTVCSEAASLVAEALAAESAAVAQADAGAQRALERHCVAVMSEGRAVASACRVAR